MPAHINRLIGALDTDERNSQYASAWRKAVTYLEASGNGLPKRYDDEGKLLPPTSAEQEEYRLRVKNTTLGVLRVRFALGFLAPASPQVQLKYDMAQWIRDNGRANWKQAFNNLLDKYPGDYDAAMAKWVELFPDRFDDVEPPQQRTVRQQSTVVAPASRSTSPKTVKIPPGGAAVARKLGIPLEEYAKQWAAVNGRSQ